MAERMTEISFEVAASECGVLDGYCSATKLTRTAVMRRLLREWSDKKQHEAIMICRTSGVNPMAAGNHREVSE